MDRKKTINYFFERDVGGTAEKKTCQEASAREKIEQVVSIIIILIVNVKKNLAQGIAYQIKSYHTLLNVKKS